MQDSLAAILKQFSDTTIKLLDPSISIEAYTEIDLSIGNKDLENLVVTNPETCQDYIETILQNSKAQVAYGGYLEQRALYDSSNRFSEGTKRNIHLGMDFWCKAGTKVLVPIAGKVHSFKNNSDTGNYGPTIVLEHRLFHKVFYTLYGHLSVASLDTLYVGKEFKAGAILATLGTTDINVNYAPHLHFQIIETIENYMGDYPGVCNSKDLAFYKNNCPNPNYLLKL